jgi:hypothetical protein
MHVRCFVHWLSFSFLLACGSSSGPQPGDIGLRVGHSMTYDATAHRVLEFGGIGVEGGASGLRASLWSWDGARWTRIDAGSGGPAARVDAAFVYDAVSQRPLLLGGRLGRAPDATPLKDVWEWTGTAWAGRADSLQVARAHAAIAFDATRQRVVLYGGLDPVSGQEAADLWELARTPGAVWTATAVTGPGNTFAPVLVFDQVAGHLWLLVSRVSDRRVLLYSWNGTTLAPVDTSGPNLTGYAVAPRGSAGASYCLVDRTARRWWRPRGFGMAVNGAWRQLRDRPPGPDTRWRSIRAGIGW